MTDATNHLKEHGIRPSVQRVAIMKYLMEHRTHPTVDTIYNDLLPAIPTLSRTTVYNTLELLADHHAALALSIDSQMVHYDGNAKPHAHFRCRCCGKIIDLPMPDMAAESDQHNEIWLVEQVEISYTGVCSACVNQQKMTTINSH